MKTTCPGPFKHKNKLDKFSSKPYVPLYHSSFGIVLPPSSSNGYKEVGTKLLSHELLMRARIPL